MMTEVRKCRVGEDDGNERKAIGRIRKLEQT